MKKFAIIVGAGTGNRLGSEVPKQFLELGGVPMLYHSMRVFHAYDPTIDIILVLSPKYLDFWKELQSTFNLSISHKVVIGGDTRFDSVKAGISAIQSDGGLVAVHDGARPFLSAKLISSLFLEAQDMGCAIPCIPLHDSIRRVYANGGTEVVDRSTLRAIQTPQVFNLEDLKEAYDKAKHHSDYTDDASVWEAFGKEVHLSQGDPSNIKITTQTDLAYARSVL